MSSDAVEEHLGVLGCLLLLLKGLEITNGISLCSCVILHHYTYLCSPLSVVFCHLFFSLQDGVMFDMIKPHASLSRLMDEYIERRGMEGHSLRFFYNGKRITKRHMQPR